MRRDDVMPVSPRVVEVASVEKRLVALSALEEAYANCDVEEANTPVRYHVGVVVAFVVVPNEVAIVQSHGRVSVSVPPSATLPPPERPLPAVTVSAPPLLRSELPIVVVETTLPVESTPRSAEASDVSHVAPELVNMVVEAWVKSVVEAAKRLVVLKAEVVALVVREAYDV